MHSYFSQFGTVTRLRLSRNKKTGKSKHYGWVEFSSREVAEIVADTMDGYLIHPHRLVCKVVETVDENVWKGANKVFKRIPWQRIHRERTDRNQKIKEVGIDYEFPLRGEKRKDAPQEVKEVKTKKGKTEKSEKTEKTEKGEKIEKPVKEKRVTSTGSKKGKGQK